MLNLVRGREFFFGLSILLGALTPCIHEDELIELIHIEDRIEKLR